MKICPCISTIWQTLYTHWRWLEWARQRIPWYSPVFPTTKKLGEIFLNFQSKKSIFLEQNLENIYLSHLSLRTTPLFMTLYIATYTSVHTVHTICRKNNYKLHPIKHSIKLSKAMRIFRMISCTPLSFGMCKNGNNSERQQAAWNSREGTIKDLE